MANPASRISWDSLEVTVGQKMYVADFYTVRFEGATTHDYHIDGTSALFAEAFKDLPAGQYNVYVRASLRDVFTEWSTPIIVDYVTELPIAPQNVSIN